MGLGYDGVKFYSDIDMSLGYYFEKAKNVLDQFKKDSEHDDINQIIELYNIYRIFTCPNIKSEYVKPYEDKVKQLMPKVACFFKGINDNSFLDQFHAVWKIYIDDFWSLIDKFKVYEHISEKTFQYLLDDSKTALYYILEHKRIVWHFDTVLAEYMRISNQTAEIIIDKFLEEKPKNTEINYYFPRSLKATEYELILDQYIDSEQPHIGKLQLLSLSQSSAECPISDKLKLKAKKKAEICLKNRVGNNVTMFYSVEMRFEDSDELVSVDLIEPTQWKLAYDASWIRNNQDYPTLLNNFIYLFGYVDLQGRCTFPVVQSQLSVLERTLGVKGIKEYQTGAVFRILDMKSSVEMQGYMSLLKGLNIYIEDIFQWFFSKYLKEEFNTSGFVFNSPSHSQSYLEKCRNLPSEMDGILKQYKLFVENGDVDRELLEISSKPLAFEALPSMLNNKYVYGKSQEIEKEQYLLFSDQSMLHYLPNKQETFKSFYEVLSSREVTLADYPEWEINNIKWLEKRGAIYIDTNGIIHSANKRIGLLYDLYTHDVVCPSYYKDKSEIEKLILNGDVQYGNTLFSIPEQKYLNYMLNKSEYSNGLDLRNKYIHSTYPLDIQKQEQDYICLLKIMIVVILKINEEFCLNYPINSNDR